MFHFGRWRACASVGQGRHEDALGLLEVAAPMRPDLRGLAAGDADLAPLKNEPRFRAILAG